ncbi:MAG: proline--tRNA ligase [Dehalococcoidia bacterium]
MRLSHLLSKTLRQAPADAETVSHQLLLRAGMVYPGASGVYSYLPLGWRAFKKVENIIREEMDRAGGQEALFPSLQPLELWQETGRDAAFGATMFSIEDRRQRRLVLGPTHEEVVAQIARSFVKSYRDLPVLVYQIQNKFRDELRPRGGLLRGREFSMKDLYSLDADEASLDHSYQLMIDAYRRIYERCHLPVVLVEADSGAIGGKESHEFTALTPTGEDEIIHCPACGYAANLEKAQGGTGDPPTEAPLPLEEIATPGVKTIEGLARFVGVPTSHTLKAVFYSADGRVVFTAIRGDLEINETKLKNLLKCHELRLATEDEVARAGLVAGSASPLGLTGIPTVGDESIALGANLVAGANREGYHVKNVTYPRDFQVDTVADIAAAAAGQGCPHCSAPLKAERSIEVGHVFKLGTFISQKLGASFLDREGVSHPIVMGSYGIGVGRLLAAIVELHHDERGITWPPSVAPYQVYLCPLTGDSSQVAQAAEELYQQLQGAGVEVLYDDREESPGVKFNDADLIGIPLRLVLSRRSLEKGSAEVKRRTEKQPSLLPIEGLAAQVKALLTQT